MKNVIAIAVMVFLLLITTAVYAQNPDIRNNTTQVEVYDVGDDVTITKNRFIWIYSATGYVDSDAGSTTSDIFCGISASNVDYEAGGDAYKLNVWTYCVYMPLATYFNADGANTGGTGGAKVYWDYTTYVESTGLAGLTLDADGGVNIPIGYIERVSDATVTLYYIKFNSFFVTNNTAYGTMPTGLVTATSITITPVTNVDAVNVIMTNTNVTNTAAHDVNWGNVNYIGAAGAAIIDIDCIAATTLTNDLSIIKIEGGTNLTFNTATVNYRGIEVDLDAVTDTDFEDFWGVEVSMPAVYQGTDPTAAVYTGGHGSVVALGYGAAIYYGYYSTLHVTDAANAKSGMSMLKNTNLTIAAAGNAAITNPIALFGMNNSSVDDGGFDITCAANGVEIQYTNANASVTAPSADTLTGNALNMTVTASVIDDANSIIASAAAGGIFIDYNLTDAGAGAITTAAFDMIAIDFDTTGAIAYAAGAYRMVSLTATDANTPAWTAGASLTSYHASLAAIDVTDADLSLYGLAITMPATYGASTEMAVSLTGDGITIGLIEDAVGMNMDCNTTNAANAYSGIVLAKSTNLTAAAAGNAAITNYSALFGLSNANVDDGGFDITCAVNAVEIDYVCLNSATTAATADTMTGNALDFSVAATVINDANSVIATASMGGIFINYDLSDAGAGSITTASFDVIGIDYDTTGAINYAAGTYNFYSVVAVDAAVPAYAIGAAISGYHLDFTGLDVSDADLDIYGLSIIMPAAYGAAEEFAMFISGDGIGIGVIEDAVGMDVDVNRTAVANDYVGINIDKNLTSNAGATAQTNSALFVSSENANTHASIMTVSNVLAQIIETNSCTAAGADVYAGTMLEIEYSATTATLGTATSSAMSLFIDYNLTETAGVLTLTDFNVALIDYDTTGTVTGTDCDINLLYIIGTDTNTPAWAGTSIFTGTRIDVSAVDDSDANMAVYGLHVTGAAGTGSTVATAIFTDATTTVTLCDGTNAITAVGASVLPTIDSTPLTNVDCWDVTGTNMTTSALIDADIGAMVSGNLIDIAIDTSAITAPSNIISITDSRDHDDAAADALRGLYIAHSGDLLGTNATTTLSLVDAVYTGTTGAGAANGVVYALRGDISGATLTLGITAAGYFVDSVSNVTLCNGVLSILATGWVKAPYVDTTKYYWVAEWDEEAAAVTRAAGLRADEWTEGGTTSGAALYTYIQATAGQLNLTTAATNDDSTWMLGLTTKFNTDNNPIFEGRFKATTITTKLYHAGITTAGVDDLIVGAAYAFANNSIEIFVDSSDVHGFGAAHIVVAGKTAAGAIESFDTGLTAVNNTFITYRIDIANVAQPVIYIDAAGGDIDAADLIAITWARGIDANVWVAPIFGVQALDAVAAPVQVDFFKAWSDR